MASWCACSGFTRAAQQFVENALLLMLASDDNRSVAELVTPVERTDA